MTKEYPTSIHTYWAQERSAVMELVERIESDRASVIADMMQAQPTDEENNRVDVYMKFPKRDVIEATVDRVYRGAVEWLEETKNRKGEKCAI